MTGTNTAGAQMKTFRLSVDNNRCRLHIGPPGAGSMLFRMAYFIPETDFFCTKITCLGQGNLQLSGNAI